jgi:membrane-bound lytic murein transglycosylase A
MQQAGPEAAQELMNTNPRYVFFQKQIISDPSLGPKGTQGTNLLAGASLAVDPAFHVFGAPVWVETRLPQTPSDWQGSPRQFLAIAQDSGGAIKGALRADLFMGSGEMAGKLAGVQKHPAKYWSLLPNAVAAQREQGS